MLSIRKYDGFHQHKLAKRLKCILIFFFQMNKYAYKYGTCHSFQEIYITFYFSKQSYA